MQFIDTFFFTMIREWQGIDRLRLDKYYFLISQVVKHGLIRIFKVRVCEARHDHFVSLSFPSRRTHPPRKAPTGQVVHWTRSCGSLLYAVPPCVQGRDRVGVCLGPTH